MPTLPGKPASLWIEGAPVVRFPPPPPDLTVDVAVLGGGVMGVSAALALADGGARVALLESERVGRGVTAHSTAKVTSLHSLTYAKLASQRGERVAREYGEANQAGLERVAAWVAEHGIECDFRRKPNYTFTDSARNVDQVREEARVARELGLPASFTTETDLPWKVAGAVRFEDQAEFHPLRYALGIAQAASDRGVLVHEGARAVGVSDGDPCVVRLERGGEVRAGKVIVATHYPFTERGGYFARMHPERSYVLAVRLRGPVPQGMYISTDGHSLRAQPGAGGGAGADGGEYLLVGGGGHKVGHASGLESYADLERFARERFDVGSIDYRWSTQDNVSPDKVPYVGLAGPTARNVYVGTAFRKWGFANATAAAMMLADLCEGREPRWLETFDSRRLGPPKALLGAAKENADVAWRFVSDRLRPGSVDDVPPGGGAVVGKPGSQLAVHRDDDGELHAVSARCTHLGCIVHWNAAERTWDCPCHGSRFEIDGRVRQGPAIAPLGTREVSPRV